MKKFVRFLPLILCACNRSEVIPDPDEVKITVYEYTPAPGQFIGDGMSAITPAEACQWAEERLAGEKFVSLGAFGGYIVVGFGQPVSSFAIKGNSIAETSNEPGIVYIMADSNKNGEPDDLWIELYGSEDAEPYAVTYYRPVEPQSAVQWTDNLGQTGEVPYVPAFHSQPSYFPEWIEGESYTLAGLCIPSKNQQDGSGLWSNEPYDWGYADNEGHDCVDHWVTFTSPIKADFIKVQTAVQAVSGPLGEVSTEVCGFKIK